MAASSSPSLLKDKHDCFWYSLSGLLNHLYGTKKGALLLNYFRGSFSCQISPLEIAKLIHKFPIVNNIFSITFENYNAIHKGEISIQSLVKKLIKEYGAVMISYDKFFGFKENKINVKPTGLLTHTFSLIHTDNKEAPYYYYDQYTQSSISEESVDFILKVMNDSVLMENDTSIYVYVINNKFIDALPKQ